MSGGGFFLLRGASGVGKSSALRYVRARLSGGGSIEVDDLWAVRAPARWDDEGQHRVALEQAAMLALDLAKRGIGPVVIVDHLAGDTVDTLLSALAVPATLLTLWCRPELLSRRIEGRPHGGFGDVAVALSRNEALAKPSRAGERWLDSSDRSAREVGDWLWEEMRGG